MELQLGLFPDFSRRQRMRRARLPGGDDKWGLKVENIDGLIGVTGWCR